MRDTMKQFTEMIDKMDRQLRNELLLTDSNKLWECTYIQAQIEKRRQGVTFSIQDHIRAMVYSMLSSGITWERVGDKIDSTTRRITAIDDVFFQYDVQQLLQCSPNELQAKIQDLKVASQYTGRQMEALLNINIPKLLNMEKEAGTIDNYYQQFIQEDATLKSLVKTLSDSKSKNKIAQMDVALVSEYLRNVGYNVPKPDRHIRRILGSDVLGMSTRKIATPLEVYDILREVAENTDKSVAEIDYILWSYCAKGYGEICTSRSPKCGSCVARNGCNKFNI